MLGRTPRGVLDLLGDAPKLRLVPIDPAAENVEGLLRDGDGLLVGQGPEPALLQGGLGRPDPGPETGEHLLRRAEAGEGRLELLPERGVVLEFEEELQLRGPEIELLVPLGLVRLALERVPLPLDLDDHVADAQEILLGGFQLARRGSALGLVFHDPGRFLDQDAPLGRPGVHNAADAALFDQGIRFSRQPRVDEEIGDVSEAAGDLVEQILALTGAVEAAGDIHLFVVGGQRPVVSGEGQGHLGQAEGLALAVPCEDQVVHPVAAQELGALLSQRPADRVGHVTLAAAVRPDDDGHAGLEREFNLVREGLEAEKGNLREMHRKDTCPWVKRVQSRGTTHIRETLSWGRIHCQAGNTTVCGSRSENYEMLWPSGPERPSFWRARPAASCSAACRLCASASTRISPSGPGTVTPIRKVG